MLRIISAFLAVPKFLQVATILSTIIFFSIELWLKNLPPLFDGADKVGDFVSQVCLSIITGYFFYAIVNQAKENKDRENLSTAISNAVTEIYYQNDQLFEEILKKVDLPRSVPPTLVEVENLLKEMEKGNHEPAVGYGYPEMKTYTWFQLIMVNQMIVKQEINRLMRFSVHLDSDLVKILIAIETSEYFKKIDAFRMFGEDFKQVSTFKNDLTTFMKINLDLMAFAYGNNMIGGLTKEQLKDVKVLITKGMSAKEIKALTKSREASKK